MRFNNISVLVVDDEPSVRSTVKGTLEDEGFKVATVKSGEEALEYIKRQKPEVILLDVLMSTGMDGIETLRKIKSSGNDSAIIMISGHGNIDMAVSAIELGALDFLEKPLSVDRMLIRLNQALEKKKLQEDYMLLKKEADERYQIIGESPEIKVLVAKIYQVSPTNSRVLIMGENGTGKELVARAIHRNSNRKEKPFIQVNCAAIPGELIESELFGHEKGSFTGAIANAQGKFEQANGGTIFLDEIGDMSPLTQSKVLRAIEEQEISRIGSKDIIRLDVRVLAATNKNLDLEVKEGRFREDLFYRLNVIPIYVPPLRERVIDIPLLANYYLAKFYRENGKREKHISPSAMESLKAYNWPGNVRELKNLMERMVIMASGDIIEASDLPDNFSYRDIPNSPKTLKEAKNDFEHKFILQALRKNNWNITETADHLGIERTNLHRKMRQYGLYKD
ncbi:sigma-54-dependent Fis family transcriptional regulator [Candidatus Poribacteria bacterium]|nr:sigma-54-dependent Fis family transcriptional regulator [Candidatus Poribacteria bacterium]